MGDVTKVIQKSKHTNMLFITFITNKENTNNYINQYIQKKVINNRKF